jgi:hypothetical protein
MPSLGISGAVPALIYAFITWTGTASHFFLPLPSVGVPVRYSPVALSYDAVAWAIYSTFN